MFELKVEGIQKLQRALNDLPQEAGKVIMQKALVEGGDIIAQQIKTNAPYHPGGTGNLKRSINVRWHKGRQPSWFTVKIGAGIQLDVGPDYTKKGNAAHLVEFGTKQHPIIPGMKYTITKKGRFKGRLTGKRALYDRRTGKFFGKKRDGILMALVFAKPHPFVIPAFRSTHNKAAQTIQKELAIEIDKAWAKMVK